MLPVSPKYTEQEHHGFHALIQEVAQEALGLWPADCYSLFSRDKPTDPWISYFKAPLFPDASAVFKITDAGTHAYLLIQHPPDPTTTSMSHLQNLSPGNTNDTLGFLSLMVEWKQDQLPKSPAWYTIQKNLNKLDPWFPAHFNPNDQIFIEGPNFRHHMNTHRLSWALCNYVQNP